MIHSLCTRQSDYTKTSLQKSGYLDKGMEKGRVTGSQFLHRKRGTRRGRRGGGEEEEEAEVEEEEEEDRRRRRRRKKKKKRRRRRRGWGVLLSIFCD